MSQAIDLLEVQILPCSFTKDVLFGSWRALNEGAEKQDGKIIFGFKVVGENRLLVVTSGGADSAVKFLNAAYGNQMEVRSTPLRGFENFASDVLGCEARGVPGARFTGADLRDGTGNLFWLRYSLNYDGLNVGQFIKHWREECDFWLDRKYRNDLQVELFKVVGQKEVHMFVRAPSADLLDDLLFTSPVFRSIGSQVKVESKSILFLGEYFAKKPKE